MNQNIFLFQTVQTITTTYETLLVSMIPDLEIPIYYRHATVCVFSFTFKKTIIYLAKSRARIKIIFYKFIYIVVIFKISSRLPEVKD